MDKSLSKRPEQKEALVTQSDWIPTLEEDKDFYDEDNLEFSPS